MFNELKTVETFTDRSSILGIADVDRFGGSKTFNFWPLAFSIADFGPPGGRKEKAQRQTEH